MSLRLSITTRWLPFHTCLFTEMYNGKFNVEKIQRNLTSVEAQSKDRLRVKLETNVYTSIDLLLCPVVNTEVRPSTLQSSIVVDYNRLR